MYLLPKVLTVKASFCPSPIGRGFQAFLLKMLRIEKLEN